MSKELEKLSLKEKWDNFLDFVDAPTKARLLDCDCKEGLEQYRYLRTEIEDALKELEVKREAIADILTGDDQKKLKALEIIKEKKVNVGLLTRCANVERYNKGICYEPKHLTPEEFDLLKEVLL